MVDRGGRPRPTVTDSNYQRELGFSGNEQTRRQNRRAHDAYYRRAPAVRHSWILPTQRGARGCNGK